MRIVDLDPHKEEQRRQMARLLVEGFRDHWPDSWPDMDAALEEVDEFAGSSERLCRLALDDNGNVLGWIGGIHDYALVWELHPLVVDPARQRQGIGRALVADLEQRVRERGGLTLQLGTDDEDGMTTLSGVDLYTNTWDHIKSIQNHGGHPYTFYQKLGYTIIGVMPDANGWGKPDILMAKRVGNRETSDEPGARSSLYWNGE
jgi:aminoglycoside 6'-N-acetyltransferase I